MTASTPPDHPDLDDDGDALVCKPGEVYGGYRIERYLACGGMSQIFVAVHAIMAREVAFKVLKLHRRQSDRSAHRIASEAMALAAIEHENVVRVHHADVDEKIGLYIVMELLHGRNMRTVLERMSLRGAHLGIAEAAAIVLDVADAVSVFHEHGIIHRDLKPENIFIHEKRKNVRVVKLLDLGAAKLPAGKSKTTDKSLTVGTLQYMPREQLLDGRVSPQSDVYSLAVVFDELISGAHPLSPGASVLDPSLRNTVIRTRILEGLYEPLTKRVPGVPVELSDFIARSVSSKLERRPESMQAFADGLRRIVRSMVQSARARSSGEVAVGQGEVIARSVEVAVASPTLAPNPNPSPSRPARVATGSLALAPAPAPVARPVATPVPVRALPPFTVAHDARIDCPSLLLVDAPGAWRFLRVPLRIRGDLGMYARGSMTIGGGDADAPLPGLGRFAVIEDLEGELRLAEQAAPIQGAKPGKPLSAYAEFSVGTYRFVLVPPTPDGLGIPPDYEKLTVARDAPLSDASLLVKAGHKWVANRKIPLRSPAPRLGGGIDTDVSLFRFPVLHAVALHPVADGYAVERLADGFRLRLEGARAPEGVLGPTGSIALDDWELVLLPGRRRTA